jgi:uncharacterized protein (TIGR02452 family)
MSQNYQYYYIENGKKNFIIFHDFDIMMNVYCAHISAFSLLNTCVYIEDKIMLEFLCLDGMEISGRIRDLKTGKNNDLYGNYIIDEQNVKINEQLCSEYNKKRIFNGNTHIFYPKYIQAQHNQQQAEAIEQEKIEKIKEICKNSPGSVETRVNVAAENFACVRKKKLNFNILKPIEYNTTTFIPLKRGNKRGKITFCKGTSNQAIHYFDNHQLLCSVMNFANSHHVGGGYIKGSMAQEEELCRTIPDLYPSLFLAADTKGMYNDNFDWRTDVKYNINLNLYRLDCTQSAGEYNFTKNIKVSIITLAAPNLRLPEELKSFKQNPEQYFGWIKNIIRLSCVVPYLSGDENKVLVLGALGCGAFAPNPQEIQNYPTSIANLFYEVLFEEGYASYYDNICFAIPPGYNYDKFQEVFKDKITSYIDAFLMQKPIIMDYGLKLEKVKKIRCNVAGCTEEHLKHYCKFCKNNDSNHFSRDCQLKK